MEWKWTLKRLDTKFYGQKPGLALQNYLTVYIIYTMKYWLLKTEPEEWSWKQQVKSGAKGAEWNGVRNFQARKNLKKMKVGDKCFFYHTGKEKKNCRDCQNHKGAFFR